MEKKKKGRGTHADLVGVVVTNRKKENTVARFKADISISAHKGVVLQSRVHVTSTEKHKST